MTLINVYDGSLLDANAVGAWNLAEWLYPNGQWTILDGDVSDISTVRTTAEVIAETVILASNNPAADAAVVELLTAYPEAGDFLRPVNPPSAGPGMTYDERLRYELEMVCDIPAQLRTSEMNALLAQYGGCGTLSLSTSDNEPAGEESRPDPPTNWAAVVSLLMLGGKLLRIF